MIVSCSNCSASLQVDASKISSAQFAIRCPKCQQIVQIQLKDNQAHDQSGSDKAAFSHDWSAQSAAAYKKASETSEKSELGANADLLRALSDVLQQQVNSKPNPTVKTQQFRRALICLAPERQTIAAQVLNDYGYDVFIAENPAQATEKIRDEEVDILIFSLDFANKFNGSTVLQQMLQKLPARERRQLFVVSVEENALTFDTHNAFMRNLNLIVNTNDLHHLPSILNRALRDYDELYRHFNHALNAVA